MTTPERSVEEELKQHCWIDRNGDHQMPLDEVVAILQAKDQQLAEREAEVIHEWNKAEQRLDGTAQGAVNAIEQFRKYLSTNTPKV